MIRRFQITFRYIGLTACLAGLLTAGGCGKQDDADKTDEMVLRFRMLVNIETLDSGNARGAYAGMVLGQICEKLYTYEYLERPYRAAPVLAEAMPEISDDLLTYTIKVKKGVYYQDDPCFEDGKGRQITAHDFVYALKRVANIKYRSQNWANIKEKFVGLDEFWEYTKQFKTEYDVDYKRQVEGVKALDDYTLQFKLVKPWPQIIDILLTDNMAAPIPPEAVDYYRQDIIRHPIGSGPYKLKTWQRGVYIELVRNENWRGGTYPDTGEPQDKVEGLLADAGKTVPFADRIIWRIIIENQPAWLLLMRGEIDGMGLQKDNFSEAVDLGNMEATKAMTDRGIKLLRYNDPSVFWIGFNFRDPILSKNLPLRKAISRCFDREKYNELFFNSRYKIAHGLIPPGLNSYDPDIYKSGYSKYDLAEAIELVKEAEKIHGGPIPKLEMAMSGTSTFHKQSAQFTQRQFKKIGLDLEIKFMDWPTYLEDNNKGKSQMFGLAGVGAGSPDAIDFLDMFTTKAFAPGPNKFFYSSPEYDALYEKAEVMPFDEEAKALYRKLEHMMLEDYPAVFTTHRVSYVLVHDWVENFKPHVFAHEAFGNCRYYNVDLEKRNAYKGLLKELKKKKD
jgi:ABC-type transport system substrate-binding protein